MWYGSSMEKLHTYGDQNYALRQAVMQAAEAMTRQIYDWPPEKTARYYGELFEGRSSLRLDLTHPEGIDPR